MDVPLALGVLDFEHDHAAAGKARSAVVVDEILLEAADRDLHGLGRGADPAREAVRVDELEQGGEGVVVAVVRCRGEEEPVLAVGSQGADRRRAQRVARVAAWAPAGAQLCTSSTMSTS